jgi:hypothetical protein
MPTTPPPDPTEHRAAVADFVARARALGPEAWDRPLGEARWTPAQTAEHLRLTYAVLLAELRGGRGLQVRTSWWLRTVLRLVFLRRILRDGRIPPGARAPRELRPGAGPFERDATLAELEALAARFEEALAERAGRDAGLTHHVFGRIGRDDGLRFCAAHVRHHAGQLPHPNP